MAESTYGFKDDEYIAIGDAARVLGVSVPTVRRWVDGGRLTSSRTPGGHHRFQVRDLRAVQAATSTRAS